MSSTGLQGIVVLHAGGASGVHPRAFKNPQTLGESGRPKGSQARIMQVLPLRYSFCAFRMSSVVFLACRCRVVVPSGASLCLRVGMFSAHLPLCQTHVPAWDLSFGGALVTFARLATLATHLDPASAAHLGLRLGNRRLRFAALNRGRCLTGSGGRRLPVGCAACGR